MTIAENAGKDGEVVVSQILKAKGDNGYNARPTIEDLKKAGVIDPVKVTKGALSNAVSVAAAEAAVAEIPEDKPAAPPAVTTWAAWVVWAAWVE